jgi:hypothetical protein
MIKKCLICNKKFKGIERKLYCSKKCRRCACYRKNKKHYIKKAKEWGEQNPEKRKQSSKKSFQKFITKNRKRYNQLMKNDYLRNKDKWYSRNKTGYIIKNGFKKIKIPINYFCKLCGTNNNLQIHHEIYPLKTKEIILAILNGKIYFLCKKCHSRIRLIL